MRQQFMIVWAAVGLLVLADIAVCRRLGLSFYGWSRLALAAAVTAAVAVGYGCSGRSPRLARAAHWTLLWLFFVNAGTILTYVAARCGGPPHDAALAGFDRALGFDWTAWYDFLARRTALRFVLWLAYLSLFPQIIVSIFWFSARERDCRNYQLLMANLVALVATVAIFVLVPALGHQDAARGPDLQILIALRRAGPLGFNLARLDGLISFPSYHTVLAALLVWAHRRSPLLPVFATVNLVMLFAIPTIGQHYLADMLAGAAVAGLAIAATAALGIHTPLVRRPAIP